MLSNEIFSYLCAAVERFQLTWHA